MGSSPSSGSLPRRRSPEASALPYAEEALTALDRYRDQSDASPPWEYASELLDDGLIDVHFDLTPRGKRATAGL